MVHATHISKSAACWRIWVIKSVSWSDALNACVTRLMHETWQVCMEQAGRVPKNAGWVPKDAEQLTPFRCFN